MLKSERFVCGSKIPNEQLDMVGPICLNPGRPKSECYASLDCYTKIGLVTREPGGQEY